MRTWLILLVACTPAKVDVEDDNIEHLAPLYTAVSPKGEVPPGTRVHVTAYASNPDKLDDVTVAVLRCPGPRRDVQCLAAGAAEVLIEGVPVYDDDLLTFDFDHDAPLDDVELVVQMRSANRHINLIATLFVAATPRPPFPQPPVEPFALLRGDTRTVLDASIINTLPAGSYEIEPEYISVLCALGCTLDPPRSFPGRTVIHLEQGREPRLYDITNGFVRYRLAVTPPQR